MSEVNVFTQTFSSPSDREAIKSAAKEAAASLLRIDAENDLISEIADRMKEEYELKISDFKNLAKMYHKQNKAEQEAKSEAQFDLYDQIFGSNGQED